MSTLFFCLIILAPILLVIGAIALVRAYLSWPLESQIAMAFAICLGIWRVNLMQWGDE